MASKALYKLLFWEGFQVPVNKRKTEIYSNSPNKRCLKSVYSAFSHRRRGGDGESVDIPTWAILRRQQHRHIGEEGPSL